MNWKKWGGVGKHRNCLPRQGAPKYVQVGSAVEISEELLGCPSKGKGFVVCVCTQERKYRKNHEDRVVRVALRRFFRLSFTRGATGDSQNTACSWFFSSCFQAKRSAFTSYVNKLAS